MRLVQINNSAETFTPTASGAIATHIWEVCKHASEMNPLVITQAGEGRMLEGVEVAGVPKWTPRRHGFRDWPRRLIRRISGWREAEQRIHARHVAGLIRKRGLERSHLVLHNDPEMAAYLKETFPKCRVVHHFHNPVVVSEGFSREFRTRVDHASAVSGYVAQEVKRVYGIDDVAVIYNGVDLECFQPREVPRSALLTVNFLGRTGIEKAPDLLLKAALALALEGVPIKVNLIGSNHWGRWEADAYQTELSNYCERLVKAGGSVEASGHLSRWDVPVKLAEADVHVLPSRWEEPCALSLLEGMATGLAVVASRTGGTPELLGSSGLLFEKDSVEELAAHLRHLIWNSGERQAMGIAARKRAESFTWERCWEGFNAMTR